MSTLTLDQVRHVARLAALELDDEELLAMRDELASVLDSMASLEAIDVAHVEPTWHPLDLPVALRPDVVLASTPRDVLLSGAPETEQGAFAVPQVLEGDE